MAGAPSRKRVVVLGAGFAGLAACEELAKGANDAGLEVVVVDRHTYNTFQPLLYQVATAGLSPSDIAYPVRSYLRRHPLVSFRQGTVVDVDLTARKVCFESDVPPLEYDYLVIATGATTNFYGVPGASSHGPAIYTMEDAVAVRDLLGAGLERAATFGATGGELTVVLVGGGPTGVEMAGTLAELRSLELETDYRGIEPGDSRIILVEQLDRLLGGFDERMSRYALEALRSRGVEVRLSTAVQEVAPDHVVLAGGERVACGLVIWSAGVHAGDLADRLAVPQTKGGRLEVTRELQLYAHPEVFAAGDVAAALAGSKGARSHGRSAPPGARALSDATGEEAAASLVPQLAQPAIQAGRHAGAQVLRLARGEELASYSYRDKGIMATIGRRAAVAQLANGIELDGTLAWFAWLGLHIVFLLGFRNRVAVLFNWAWRYLWWRRGTRLIAGSA
jgi:NADH dehydrogenase